MSKHRPWFDDTDNEPDEPDGVDEYGDDSSDTVPCPECGADVYEDAEQCPHCGNYITHDTNAWAGKPLWWIVLGAVGIAALIIALLGITCF